MNSSTPGFLVCHYLPKFVQTHIHESVMPSNHIIHCHPLLLLPSVFPRIKFPKSMFFQSGGQSIGTSASASVLPMNIHGWFPLGLTGLISLHYKGLSRVFSNSSPKVTILWHSSIFMVQHSHTYIHTTGKTIALTRWTFVSKVMSLLFNVLSRLVIAFLPRSNRLLISWLQSPSAVILEPEKIVCHWFHCCPIYLSWSDGTGCYDLSFLNDEFLASFFTLLFHFHQEAL